MSSEEGYKQLIFFIKMSAEEDIKEQDKSKGDYIPVVEQLSAVYRNVNDGPGGDQEERYKAVVRRFQ